MSLFKLAFRNISSKPFRSAATALAIAFAVAMIFAMLSFKGAVYDYIFSTQTAIAGDSDIRIVTNSSSARLTEVAGPLENLKTEGLIEEICPSLSLYATAVGKFSGAENFSFDGEYVGVRGFRAGQLDALQKIKLKSGSFDKLSGGINTDNVIISEAAAKHFGLSLGDIVELKLGGEAVKFLVEGIAEPSGYFLDDSPYLFLGDVRQVSKLITGAVELSNPACNEIYVKTADGVDVDKLIEEISGMSEYSSMLVERCGKGGYIAEQVNALSAPVILSGAAVLALSIAVIIMLFLMGSGEKVSLISKYKAVGATKKQIFGIFMTESAIFAGIGAIVGSALAVGIFAALIKLTLSGAAALNISVWRLFLSAVLGIISATLGSLIPILRAFKGTIRQNQTNSERPSKFFKIFFPIFAALAIISVAVEFSTPKLCAVFGVISLVVILCALGTGIPMLLKGVGSAMKKSRVPESRIAGNAMARENRFARSITLFAVGMTVSMLLFMSWSLTKSVFSDYLSDFDNMVFVTNIRADSDVAEFEAVEGVETAVKMIWRQGELSVGTADKTINILGSKDALELVDFEYITPKNDVKTKLFGDEPCLILDIAMRELYGVEVGDKLALSLDGETKELTVGGFLKHRLFSGNYAVISEDVIGELFGIYPDTVVAVTGENASAVAGRLREKFAKNNYYAVEVLTAYKWDMQSTDAVFDLIGTLAFTVAIFIFAVTLAVTLVGRSFEEKGRTALLNAGMSKKSLLISEFLQHLVVAAIAFIISFALSALLTACLIHALRLFGLYFEFMYEAWVTFAVGAIMAVGYAIVPVAFNFKKGYNIKKR